VRRRNHADGEIVMSFHGSWLVSRRDRNGDDPLHHVDHPLEFWDELRGRVPGARFWLIGDAGKRVCRSCEGRDDILVPGHVVHQDLLAYVSNNDIALDARSVDHGAFQTTTVVTFMGCGVPRSRTITSAPLRGRRAIRSCDKELGIAARVARVAQDYDVARRYPGLMDRYL
jgi:hypothetical protein